MSQGKIKGVAPNAKLVILKVLDDKGNGKLSHMLAGISWIEKNWQKYEIQIVNISIGAISSRLIGENSQLVKAVNRLWDLGLVVCVAAGNEGDRITTPGICRKSITVGSSDDSIMADQYGNIYKNYSGKGPTKNCVCKPEIVAPGTNILATNAMNKNLTGPYTLKSGTSMSTPIVSGAVALLLEKYPNMSNKEVKLRLKYTAKKLSLPQNHQGWGQISIVNLLKDDYF